MPSLLCRSQSCGNLMMNMHRSKHSMMGSPKKTSRNKKLRGGGNNKAHHPCSSLAQQRQRDHNAKKSAEQNAAFALEMEPEDQDFSSSSTHHDMTQATMTEGYSESCPDDSFVSSQGHDSLLAADQDRLHDASFSSLTKSPHKKTAGLHVISPAAAAAAVSPLRMTKATHGPKEAPAPHLVSPPPLLFECDEEDDDDDSSNSSQDHSSSSSSSDSHNSSLAAQSTASSHRRRLLLSKQQQHSFASTRRLAAVVDQLDAIRHQLQLVTQQLDVVHDALTLHRRRAVARYQADNPQGALLSWRKVCKLQTTREAPLQQKWQRLNDLEQQVARQQERLTAAPDALLGAFLSQSLYQDVERQVRRETRTEHAGDDPREIVEVAVGNTTHKNNKCALTDDDALLADLKAHVQRQQQQEEQSESSSSRSESSSHSSD